MQQEHLGYLGPPLLPLSAPRIAFCKVLSYRPHHDFIANGAGKRGRVPAKRKYARPGLPLGVLSEGQAPIHRVTSTVSGCGTRKSTRRLNDDPTGVGSKAENTNRRRRSSFCSTMKIRLKARKTIAPTGTAMPKVTRGLSGIATMPRTTMAIARVAATSLSTTGISIRTG